MRRRTNISLLALVVVVLAALAFAIPASSVEFNTTLKLEADMSVYYGVPPALTGSLRFGEVGLEERTIQITDCTSELGTAQTGSFGNYNYEPTVPDAVGTVSYQANFAGDTVDGTTYDPASSDCVQVNVDQAPTETSIGPTIPPVTLTLGETLSVNYRVASSWGVSGNTTGGTVSIEETSGLGTLGCGTGDPLSVSQTPGWGTPGTLTCTPTAAGEYSYIVDYTGDDNYLGSESNEATLTVDKADQDTLLVTGPASAIYGDPDATITTTGGSGTGAVTFDAGNSAACSIVDGMLHVTAGTGSCTITATQAADDDYNATTSAPYTVTIDPTYAGTPGQRTCVKDSIAALVEDHGSLKTAATAHGFANQTALRKDVQTYCKA